LAVRIVGCAGIFTVVLCSGLFRDELDSSSSLPLELTQVQNILLCCYIIILVVCLLTVHRCYTYYQDLRTNAMSITPYSVHPLRFNYFQHHYCQKQREAHPRHCQHLSNVKSQKFALICQPPSPVLSSFSTKETISREQTSAVSDFTNTTYKV